jgi:hypothetical protein
VYAILISSIKIIFYLKLLPLEICLSNSEPKL